MKIIWLGHSCFLFENSQGIKILTDPFNELIKKINFINNIDLVTVSHNHFDHNYISPFEKTAKIINTPGSFIENDILLKGFKSFHDDVNGRKRGENIIFKLKIDEYNICHLGDLGHEPSEDIISEIGELDILLIPVGGNYTLNGKKAAKVAKKFNSKLIIPMHYKMPNIPFPLEGAEQFILNMGNVKKLSTSSLVIDNKITTTNKVLILNMKEPFM